MPKFSVKVRAPTAPRDFGGLPPCVNVTPGKFVPAPVFHVSFPDLGPDDLLELSVYVSALAYISKQMDYPHHLSNYLCAFADSMKAVSTKI